MTRVVLHSLFTTPVENWIFIETSYNTPWDNLLPQQRRIDHRTMYGFCQGFYQYDEHSHNRESQRLSDTMTNGSWNTDADGTHRGNMPFMMDNKQVRRALIQMCKLEESANVSSLPMLEHDEIVKEHCHKHCYSAEWQKNQRTLNTTIRVTERALNDNNVLRALLTLSHAEQEIGFRKHNVTATYIWSRHLHPFWLECKWDVLFAIHDNAYNSERILVVNGVTYADERTEPHRKHLVMAPLWSDQVENQCEGKNEHGDRELYYRDQSIYDYGNLWDYQLRSPEHRHNIVTFVNKPYIFWRDRNGSRPKQRCKKMLALRSSADASFGAHRYSIDQATRRGPKPPKEKDDPGGNPDFVSRSLSMGLFPSGGQADAANTLLSHLKGYRLRQAWKFEDLLGRGLSPTLYNYSVDKAKHSNIPLTQVISECANGHHDCRPRGFAAYQRAMCHHMSNPTDMECTRDT